MVETTRKLEKVAVDLIDIRAEGKYVLVLIDYFTRVMSATVLRDKKAETVIAAIQRYYVRGLRPEELITDNGREFTSTTFKEFCAEKNIEHRIVSVESHRSNGRVERVIGTIRERLEKVKEGKLEERIARICENYNQTYHSALKCTPEEAWKEDPDEVMLRNSRLGDYAKSFKRRYREKFEQGDEVRIAQRQNLKGLPKEAKGRYTGRGIIVEECEGDSYIVKTEEGRLTKKRHYDLKEVRNRRSVVEEHERKRLAGEEGRTNERLAIEEKVT